MTNSIVYSYDSKECKVVAIKIDFADPNNLEALARVAKIHVPIVEAMKGDLNTLFECVELNLPNLPVVLKVVDSSVVGVTCEQ